MRIRDRAKKLADSNGSQWKVVAILRRGKSPVRVLSNTITLHAEARMAKHIKRGDTLEVLRWSRKTGELTMAKPCVVCQELLSKTEVGKVTYSDWKGNIKRLKL